MKACFSRLWRHSLDLPDEVTNQARHHAGLSFSRLS